MSTGPRASHRIDQIEFPSTPLSAWFTWFPSIAVGGESESRLYAVTDRELQVKLESFVGQVGVHLFAPIDLPDSVLDPISGITATTAQVSGNVNPNGAATTWRFEYRLPGAEEWSTGPSGNAGEGTAPQPVSGELTGLEPNREYEVRLVARGAAGKDVASVVRTFTTATQVPFAHTRDASPRTDTTARLNGYINPRNSATTYYFEWGPTDAYGNRVPASEGADAGSGGGQVLASQEIGGLQPGTTYSYRLVAENAAGTAYGEERTFTTRSAAEMVPQVRGIELVTSQDKGNQNAGGFIGKAGQRVLWATPTGAPGSSQGKDAMFLAERTPTRWNSQSLLPPGDRLLSEGERAYALLTTSPDYSKLIFQVGEAAEGGAGDEISFVRYDRSTGEQELLLHLPEIGRAHV